MNQGYKLNEILIFPSDSKAFIYMCSVIHTLHVDYIIYSFALPVWFPVTYIELCLFYISLTKMTCYLNYNHKLERWNQVGLTMTEYVRFLGIKYSLISILLSNYILIIIWTMCGAIYFLHFHTGILKYLYVFSWGSLSTRCQGTIRESEWFIKNKNLHG